MATVRKLSDLFVPSSVSKREVKARVGKTIKKETDVIHPAVNLSPLSHYERKIVLHLRTSDSGVIVVLPLLSLLPRSSDQDLEKLSLVSPGFKPR